MKSKGSVREMSENNELDLKNSLFNAYISKQNFSHVACNEN